MAYIGDQYCADRLTVLAEGLGGSVVAIVDTALADYSFDMLALIKTPLGLYITTDSGCSCPTPFESTTRDDLTGPLTLEQVIEEYTSLVVSDGRYYSLSEADRDANITILRGAGE